MESTGRPTAHDRPIVGLMTGSFHTDYSRTIAQNITDFFGKENIELFLFQGLDAARFLNAECSVDDGFDSHYYSLFEYSKFLDLDALVISFGTISAIPDPVSLEKFVARLPKVPIILLEDETKLPNSTFITIDNYVGMKSCVDHLIEEHKYKNILFLAGPKGIHDAEMRKKAYLDSMRAHGLEIKPDMLVHGNFTDHVEPELEKLLAAYPRPDAIVCANDEMAECTYRVLRAHGLQPGKDVGVTGFDDNAAAVYMDPPLTSVRQNCEKVASEVVRIVKCYLRGEQPEPVYLPAELVLRNSCGCDGDSENTVIRKQKRAQMDRRKIKQLMNENMICSLMLRNLLKENISVHDFFHNLARVLGSFGTEKSVIALLPEPLDVTKCDKLFLPDEIRVHMLMIGGEIETFSRKEAPKLLAYEKGAYSHDPHPNNTPKAVFPLFYGNMHYGVFIASIKQADMIFYYSLSLEIGTGLRYLFMALAEQEARKALEEKNQILDFSASHDLLTGLLNRAGVMNKVYNLVRGEAENARFVVIMADIDHLKQINDTFGHSGGDKSIESAAKILRGVLPAHSPIGRAGGDEFIALFKCDDTRDEAWFKAAIKNTCAEFNGQSDLPFYVELSVGCAVFDKEEASEIPNFIKTADEDLYKAKKLRRQSVIKE
ncbi:MAG: GGDEF domain-containing protein [Oscillospiraceae bacterium]|nr:GGDEF domain-containing protein [Oscillospiraceae bacterium]